MKLPQKSDEILLTTSFFAEAKLTSTLKLIIEELSKLPSIEIVSKGTTIRCIVDKKGLDAEVIFRHDSIVYIFRFKKPSQAEYAKHLIAFISIISFLRDHYEVKIDTLYRYVVQALQDSIYEFGQYRSMDEIERAHMTINALNESNCKLAELLFELEQHKIIQEQKIAILESFAKAIIGNDSPQATKMLNSFGVSNEAIQKIEKILK
jgi:hypothetical protein